MMKSAKDRLADLGIPELSNNVIVFRLAKMEYDDAVEKSYYIVGLLAVAYSRPIDRVEIVGTYEVLPYITVWVYFRPEFELMSATTFPTTISGEYWSLFGYKDFVNNQINVRFHVVVCRYCGKSAERGVSASCPNCGADYV